MFSKQLSGAMKTRYYANLIENSITEGCVTTYPRIHHLSRECVSASVKTEVWKDTFELIH